MPTANHIFYIPLMLAVGFAAGAAWGRSALRAELALAERRKRREAAIARGESPESEAR
jgi:hypothetical protein